MVFEINLRKYFTPKAIAQILETLPPLETPILDRIYPESRRKQHQLPVLGIDEITAVVKNVPVVRRGTQAVPAPSADTRAITYIEPQPVEVSTFITAKELNDLKLLAETSIQNYIAGKIDYLRQVIRKTTEALAVQSLKGEISYPMKTLTGYDTYTVNFGPTLSYIPDKKWDATDKTIADLLKDLLEITKVIKENSGYGNIRFFAGSDAFLALANLVLKQAGDAPIKAEVTEKGVTLAGFTIEYLDAVYTDYINNNTYSAIDPDKVLAIAMDAPFTLWYCAIDDIEAGLVAMPFYAVPDTKKNPSGVEIVAKSKPLPVPVPKAICWADVI